MGAKKRVKMLRQKSGLCIATGSPVGFTLVELMIVVLILGILVGIAVPLYNASQERAAESACLSNQRVINKASMEWGMERGTVSRPFAADVQQLVDDGYLRHVPACKGHPFTKIDDATGLTECPAGGRHVLP